MVPADVQIGRARRVDNAERNARGLAASSASAPGTETQCSVYRPVYIPHQTALLVFGRPLHLAHDIPSRRIKLCDDNQVARKDWNEVERVYEESRKLAHEVAGKRIFLPPDWCGRIGEVRYLIYERRQLEGQAKVDKERLGQWEKEMPEAIGRIREALQKLPTAQYPHVRLGAETWRRVQRLLRDASFPEEWDVLERMFPDAGAFV